MNRFLWTKDLRHMRKFSCENKTEKILQDECWQVTVKGKVIKSTSISELLTSKVKQAVVLGAGPSLSDVRIDEISNSNTDVYALNGAIYFYNDKLDLENKSLAPDYHCIMDRNFLLHNEDSISSWVKPKKGYILSPYAFSYLYQFILADQASYIVEFVNEGFGSKKFDCFDDFPDRVKGMFHKDKSHYETQKSWSQIGWSDQIQDGLFTGATVLFPMLQLCNMIGYDHLDLFGIDLKGVERFYNENHLAPSQIDSDFSKVILPSFEVMAQKRSGKMSIHNHSKVCQIPTDYYQSN